MGPCHYMLYHSTTLLYQNETMLYRTPHDYKTPGFSCMSADIQEKDLNEAKKTCILKGHRQNPSEPQNNFHCNLYINTQLYTLR